MSNQYFTVDSFRLASGTSLPALKLAYRTLGDARNPTILIPTCFGGRLSTTMIELLKRPSLSQNHYHIVLVALIGNGESSSPSNTASPYHGPKFPTIEYADNIRAQHLLLTTHLKIDHLHAVLGFSMGGQQAYHWAVMFPDFLARAIIICSSARTSWHNYAFLEGPKAALVNSEDFMAGDYTKQPVKGKEAFCRVYATWAMSASWFRQELFKTGMRRCSFHDWVEKDWIERYAGWDANDLLCLLNTVYTRPIVLTN